MQASFLKVIMQFARNESGLSAVEYGLLAAGIAIGLFTIISGIGTSLQAIFSNVGAEVSQAG